MEMPNENDNENENIINIPFNPAFTGIALDLHLDNIGVEDIEDIFLRFWYSGNSTTIDIPPPDEKVPDTFPLEIEPEKECPVCNSEENLLLLGCQHTVCDSCIRKLPNKNCPTCRERISMKLVKRRTR
jgi:hypothetical protein